MKTYRADRWLTLLGIASRKEAAALIKSGQVALANGLEKKPDTKLAEGDTIIVIGQQHKLSEFAYYMMNKPAGILSASRDKHSQTVIDLLPKELRRPGLFPAGRLDKDTEGFVIITDDGQFAHRILAPKNMVPKTYLARLDKPFQLEKLAEEFRHGVDIGEDKPTLPAELSLIEDSLEPLAQLVINEGKFHQVKRMFLAFGMEVIYLKRTKIGNLCLDDSLKIGESRTCTDEELGKI